MAEAVANDMRRKPRFYVGMAAAAVLTIFAGFAQPYYFKAFAPTPPVAPLVHAHAMVFTTWLLLLFSQTMLVVRGRVDIHRRLGVAGGVLAMLMVVLGVMTAIHGGRHGWNPGGPFPDALGFMVVPSGDILIFAGFVAAGIYHRRRPEVHKRLMVLATIGGLLWPAIVRLPFVRGVPVLMFGLMVPFVVAGPIYDVMSRGRVHPVNLWGGLLILASFPIRTALGMTDSWRSFAAWLIR